VFALYLERNYTEGLLEKVLAQIKETMLEHLFFFLLHLFQFTIHSQPFIPTSGKYGRKKDLKGGG
jgi:hypothetical protein